MPSAGLDIGYCDKDAQGSGSGCKASKDDKKHKSITAVHFKSGETRGGPGKLVSVVSNLESPEKQRAKWGCAGGTRASISGISGLGQDLQV